MIVVLTTADSRDVLEQLAGQLVDQRLAACCQIDGPITSVYVWQGQREMATEYRCLIKTTAAMYEQVESYLLQHHPYDQPQIVAIEADRFESGYGAWVEQMTGD